MPPLPLIYTRARGVLKLILAVLWSLLLVPIQSLLLLFRIPKPLIYVIPQLWHQGLCRILELRIRIHLSAPPGQNKGTRQQTLYVFNHLSYLDIPVIGSLIRASFVAKKDVAGWPVFGFLARLQNTAFISRTRTDAIREAGALSVRIEDGDSLILFPEGTSTNGKDILPFKSSLLAIAETATIKKNTPIVIQPCCLRIVPHGDHDDNTDHYCWYGDMDLLPHIGAFLCNRGADIHISFAVPFTASKNMNRKDIAGKARQACLDLFKGVAPPARPT